MVITVGGGGGVGGAGPDGIQSTPLALVIIFSSQLKLSDSPLPRFFCPSLCSAFVSLSSDNADTGMGDNGGNAITIATTSTVRNVGILIINFIDLHIVAINNYIWIENENARFYGQTYGIIFN